MKQKTVAMLLREGSAHLSASGLPEARREAEALLVSLLSCRRIDLYLNPEKTLPDGQERQWEEWLDRRGRREPLQYIVGEVDFCGRVLSVCPGVFIPRPETEWMVEEAKKIMPRPTRILDLCTGSGALAIALARVFPEAAVVATDYAMQALGVAQSNARRHGVTDQISWICGDFFNPIFPDGRFDLIVCNPPYIPEEDLSLLPPEVRDYEPPLALFAQDGVFYHRILREGSAYLSGSGTILVEIGDGQSGQFSAWAGEMGWQLTLVPDGAGIDRVAVLQRQ